MLCIVQNNALEANQVSVSRMYYLQLTSVVVCCGQFRQNHVQVGGFSGLPQEDLACTTAIAGLAAGRLYSGECCIGKAWALGRNACPDVFHVAFHFLHDRFLLRQRLLDVHFHFLAGVDLAGLCRL